MAILELERAIIDAKCPPWDTTSLTEGAEVTYTGFRNSEPAKAMEIVGSSVTRYDGQGGVWELRDNAAAGFSGGPVARRHNDMWHVVGLVVSRLEHEPLRTCCIPVPALQQVLARLDLTLPVAEASTRSTQMRSPHTGEDEVPQSRGATTSAAQPGRRDRSGDRKSSRVFLSYSHDSPAHRERVLALAGRLRRDGVDAWLDRYSPNPPEGWPRWIQRELEQADSVLVVCTETFRRRFDRREAPGSGRSVTWEGLLASQLLDESGTRNKKLIPVLFEDGQEADIPLPLRLYTHHRLPAQYDDLYRHLTEQPEVVAPGLGAMREVTPQSEGIQDSGDRPLSPFLPGVIIDRAEDFVGRRGQLDEIRNAVHHRQPIQILGEARMGKSSLLRRVAKDLVPPDMRVARVHARGQSGWSPRELVLAIADALKQRDAVERILSAPRAANDQSPSVMDALRSLTPCALLLDDADAIAKAGHRFERGFFDTCRALTQERRLLWISASRRDLEGLFSETGLTSEFLNDCRRVVVGQLDENEANQLLGVLGISAAARAWALAAGWPQGLQWLGDKLWRDGEADAIEDDFANAMEQSFRNWWKLRTQADRALLRRLIVPTPTSELSRPERRIVRKLVSRGLIAEKEGVFSLRGVAWANWVRDVE